MQNGKGVDLDGKGGREVFEEVEEGKTIPRIYYIRKVSMLNKRESTFFKC